jgi:hypothetical protein
MSELIPMNDLEALKAAGVLYPQTEHGWRWLYRHRHIKGFSGAFRRVGRRILVDVRAYIDTVRAQPH